MVEVMRRDFNEHHLTQVPPTENQLGEMQMMEEVRVFLSWYTKYRATVFNVIKNYKEMNFFYNCLGKISRSELNIILVTLFVGNQPIRIQHCPK